MILKNYPLYINATQLNSGRALLLAGGCLVAGSFAGMQVCEAPLCAEQGGVRKREAGRPRKEKVAEHDCAKAAGFRDGQSLGEVPLKTYSNFEGLRR